MSEEQFKVLKKKRGAVKRSLTQLKNYISDVKFDNENSELNDQNEFILLKKFGVLKQCDKNYREVYDQLVEVAAQLDEENSSDAVEDDCLEFQNSYFQIEYQFLSLIKSFEQSRKLIVDKIESDLNPLSVEKLTTSDSVNTAENLQSDVKPVSDDHITLKSTLNDIENKKNPNANSSFINGKKSSPSQFESVVKEENHHSHYNLIKLPQISLPTFDGNLQNWLGFRDSFNDLIIANPTISDIQRFYYLDGSLSGNARSTIANIQISSHGFELAWRSLLSKYDDQKAIMENHFHSFFNLKPVLRENRNDILRLLDDSQKHIRALEKLGEILSDAVITYTVKQRFDSETRKLWENEDVSETSPSWNKMIEFMNRRCRALVNVSDLNSKSGFSNQNRRNLSRTFVTSNEISKPNQQLTCVLCKSAHQIAECSEFKVKTPSQRYDLTKQLNLCLKCLRSWHKVAFCRGPNCQKCRGKHHTLLHLERNNTTDAHNTTSKSGSAFLSVQSQSETSSTEQPCSSHQQTSLFCNASSQRMILLPTAVILIMDSSGKYHECRALLDSASQSNFITNKFADLLSVQRQKVEFSICGLNKLSTKLTQKLKTTIKSCVTDFSIESEFLIVPQIANKLPNHSFDVNWKNRLPSHVQLSDPRFNIANQIDLLLGVDIFYKIIEDGSVKLSHDTPMLHKTAFGWVVGGNIDTHLNSFVCIHEDCEEESLNELIQKFWVMESLEQKSKMSAEEKECENRFETSYTRNESGRFVVELPLKENVENLGDSRCQALKRFSYLEGKFRKNPVLKEKYIAFMNEYELLGHMKLCEPDRDIEKSIQYFLPHHAVLKDSKIRVVFDASAKSATNVSLNDVLMVGPVVQPDLFSIILNFRKFAYVFTTDIEKMYRQILVHAKHQPLQKILWRLSEDQPVREFELQTVTYGTSAAPYLATKCLVQLAKEEKNRFPLASNATLNHFYVDDLLVGSDSLEEALQIQTELIEMLKNAGMSLRKWSSNQRELIKKIAPEDRAQVEGSNETIKTLGLIWKPTDDYFKFLISPINYSSPSTKRQVLSSIAKLFDPLGLIAPVVVTAKVLMQQIWVSKIEWDEVLPTHLQIAWDKFMEELPFVNDIVLERKILSSNAKTVEIHGFSDASCTAYGACIYLRSSDANGQNLVKLVCSKSRVAPLSTTSIPRLELNAAVLLSRLTNKVVDSLKLSYNRIILWTDSSIVLSWIRMPPYQLKTYVANRVSEIQEHTSSMVWRHVDSKNNVADVLSRGSLPRDLKQHPQWFEGPHFLKLPEENWPNKFIEIKQVPEIKSNLLTFVSLQKPYVDVLNIEKYDSFLKLIRAIAWWRRLWKFYTAKDKSNIQKGNLSVSDLAEATKCAVRIVQRSKFSCELASLKKNNEVDTKSKLIRLTPFVDDDVILRVGGRLNNSKSLSMEQKHPIVLADHHITRLLVKRTHVENLHSGLQQTLSVIRQKYWIVNGKNVVKRVIHFCLPCYKLNPKTMTQLMGNLPECRIESSRPFFVTGIDFCGPFSVRYRNMRKETYDKVYVCIFVCFSIKAVHLEVVEDLSADAFLAALKRFFSRRGKCFQLWSDNATNFVGACNKMSQLHQMFIDKNQSIINFCSSEGVQWKFIPPRAPHFGGIWESGVKVIKTHMKKVIGTSVLTLEFLYTLVIQIEGVMNSRPLTEMSSDPNDLEPITPGHFLIGTSINTILEPNITTLPSNRLTQWQRITQMVQQFEKRFRDEYINTLQQRDKWSKPQRNLQCGDIVIVKEDNLPSTQWLTGRIQEVIAGQDDKVRCAIVRTKNGCFKRPITKLARIPTNDVNLPVPQ